MAQGHAENLIVGIPTARSPIPLGPANIAQRTSHLLPVSCGLQYGWTSSAVGME
jgi:hypothetical protein